MAPFGCVVFHLLVLVTGHLVSCGNILTQVFGCKEKVWGPNFFHDSSSPLRPAHMLFFGFSTQQECQATMCAPRCGISPLPPSPQSSNQQRLIARPTPLKSSDPPKDRDLGLPKISDEEINEKELKAILGPNAQVILDDAGQVIGVETPSGTDIDAKSRPRPQGGDRNIPGDDGSLCCSTREVFYFNRTLVDYYGRPQVIAQINEVGVFQLVRHGLCGNTGACAGDCDQIYVTVPLVVHPTKAGQKVSFSLFKIPGYCTCRVRGLRKSALNKNDLSQ